MEAHAYIEDCAEYLKYNPYDAAIREHVGWSDVPTMEEWLKYKRRKYDLPAKAMLLASKIPFVGSKSLAKQATDIADLASKLENIEKATEWGKTKVNYVFDDLEYCRVCDSLNNFDKKEFIMDLRPIDWPLEGRKYQNAIARYYLKEDIP